MVAHFCSIEAMFHIVLHQPEIPPNTGNVIRLAANAGAHLHLIRPLGFSLDDRSLARAGLDYHDLARVTVHDSLSACLSSLPDCRAFALSTRGRARFDRVPYQAGDVFVFGSETAGLPADVLDRFPEAQRLCLPMRPGNRSLNLSNTVAIVVFEAWRQLGFSGAAGD